MKMKGRKRLAFLLCFVLLYYTMTVQPRLRLTPAAFAENSGEAEEFLYAAAERDDGTFSVTVPGSDGETITFFAVFDNAGNITQAQGLGDSYQSEETMNGPWYLGQSFYLLAYTDFSCSPEGISSGTPVDAEVYDLIENVSVAVQDEASGLNSVTELSSPAFSGYPVHTFSLSQKIPAPFNTGLDIHFDYAGESCCFHISVFYEENQGEGPGGESGGGEVQPSGLRYFAEIQYQGEKMSVCLANFHDGGFRAANRLGDNFRAGDTGPLPWYSTSNLYLMAFENFGDQEKEKPAPADFVNAIQIESVQIDFSSPMAVAGPVSATAVSRDSNIDGYTNYEVNGFRLNTTYGEPFAMDLIVTFSLDESIQPSLETDLDMNTSVGSLGDGRYQIKTYVFYEEDPNAYVTASDLTTSAALNEVLSSKEKLQDYLETHNIHYSFSKGTVELTLPSLAYDEIIVCDVAEAGMEGRWFVKLIGSGETVLPGLEARSGLGFVENLVFSGNAVQGNGARCGIWYNGNQSRNMVSWTSNSISDCSFIGLDYGVLTTMNGYCGRIQNCRFESCGSGVVIDCGGLANAAPNSVISYNTFRTCSEAIAVNGLPATITNYMFRVHHNLFEGNDIDVRSDIPGDQFFYMNFFGDSDGVQRSARLVENNGALLAINPCLRSREVNDNLYGIDPSRNGKNRILKEDARSMPIDPEALAGVEIDVIDSPDAAPIGTFFFGGDAT